MAITASRLGSSSVMLDWSNLAQLLGTLKVDKLDPAPLQAAWNKLNARFESKEIGFFDSPTLNDLSQLAESEDLARKLLEQKQFTDCLVLGIGGSALGPKAVLSALAHQRKGPGAEIRFHFAENPDPIDWNLTLKNLNPNQTLVCVITKSGGTYETIAQLTLALNWLGEARWKTHVVAITDPQKGDLRKFATQQQIPTLCIAPSIGGRFSVFTPVGLFIAALGGLSIREFMIGAEDLRKYTAKTAPERNPLFTVAAHLISLYPEKSVHVCMPYSSRLKELASWWVQLWGESLGKDGKGFTPVGATGATDQHSILQLLRDGPNDKVTFFVTVDEATDPVKSTPLSPKHTAQLQSFLLLQGVSLHQLIKTEYEATSLVLTRNKRPNLTFRLDGLHEKSLGALMFATCVFTAFLGTLWEVNPFDQPGVEEGKILTQDSLTEQKGHSRTEDDTDTQVHRLRLHLSD